MANKQQLGFKHSDYFYNPETTPYQEGGTHIGHPHSVYWHYGNKIFVGTQRTLEKSKGSGVR